MTALTHKENDLHNRLIVAEFNLAQAEEELRRLYEEIEALRARLAQPEPEELGEVIPADEEQLKRIAKLIEPEPVVWADKYDIQREGHDFWVSRQQPAKNGVPLYTAPPQREWVGLTDEEILEEYRQSYGDDGNLTDVYFAHAIEAKLKEKNSA